MNDLKNIDGKSCNFKELLEQQHQFPCEYTFRFIVPSGQQAKLELCLPLEKIERIFSKNSKYIRSLLKLQVNSAEEIITIYQKVGKVEGVIAL